MDAINKKIAEELNAYASECKKSHKYKTAKVIVERAIKMSPESGVLYNNLGAILWNLNRFQEAEASFRKSFTLGYDNETSQANLGLLLASANRFDEAKECFTIATELKPDNKQAKWENALTLLDAGEWTEGFKEYDVRRDVKAEIKPLNYTLWNGEDLNDKTIYIQSEQGFGDRILFSRYIHWLKVTYPRVRILFLCDPKLHNLFWNLKLATDLEFIPDKVPWPKADYGQYLLNLPRLHGTTPDNVYPDPGYILERAKLTPCNIPIPEIPDNLKVGICWTGNPVMEQNIQRTIPFERLLELAENPDVLLYSFQVGNNDIDTYIADRLICNIAPELEKEGFAGTAAAMLKMDVIVTCCTSIAHLAGALGIPCYVLLCYAPYWVWLRERDTSVWYPSIKLIRQKEPGGWDYCIDEIKKEINLLAKNKDSYMNH